MKNINLKWQECIQKYPQGTKFFLLFSLFTFAFFIFSILNTSTISPSIYTARDIHNSNEILKGNFLWFGPDLSGGGKSPGPFYYWLLAIPLFITSSWHYLSFFCNLLAATAAILIWHFLNQNRSQLIAFIGFFSFINSFIVLNNLMEGWNPSYLYLFQIIPLVFLNNKSFKNDGIIFFVFFILGLSIQIHMTQFLFVIAGLIYLSIQPIEYQKKLKLILLSLFAFIIPIIPYLLWLYFEGTNQGAFGNTFFALETLFTHKKNTSLLQSLEYIFKDIFIKDLLLIPLVVTSFFSNEKLIKKYLYLFIVLMISTFMFFLIGEELMFLRYITPFAAISCLWFSLKISEIDNSKKLTLIFLTSIFAMTLFMISKSLKIELYEIQLGFGHLVILISLSAIIYFLSVNPSRKMLLILTFLTFMRLELDLRALRSYELTVEGLPFNYQSLKTFASVVVDNTNWTYEEFRTKTLLIGFDRENDLTLFFSDAKYTNISSAQEKNYDGLIAIRNSLSDFIAPTYLNWKNLQAHFPIEVSEAGLAKKIICAKLIKSTDFQYCFYNITNKYNKFKWNNIGYAYQYIQPSLLTANKTSGLHKINKDNAIFYLNHCQVHHSQCTSYLKVNINNNIFEVEILGDPVGVADPAPNPSAVTTLKNVTLEFVCGDSSHQEMIVTHMGFSPSRSTFLSPYTKMISMPCVNPDKISIFGTEESILNNYNIQKPKQFKMEWTRYGL